MRLLVLESIMFALQRIRSHWVSGTCCVGLPVLFESIHDMTSASCLKACRLLCTAATAHTSTKSCQTPRMTGAAACPKPRNPKPLNPYTTDGVCGVYGLSKTFRLCGTELQERV